MAELVEQDIKAVIITVSHMFKSWRNDWTYQIETQKYEKYLNKILEMKMMSKIKKYTEQD